LKNKILLTGANGFLGSHILKKLLKNKNDVVIIVRETSDLSRIKNLTGFSTFKIDENFSNISILYEMYSIETIIHVATEYGRSSLYSNVINSNVIFPIKLIELADKNKLKLFINTDSFSCKFQNSSYLKEYISSKIFFKNYLKTLSGIKVANLQLEHVFGEQDSKGKFVTFLLESMLSNQVFINLTEGTQKRDFIYVSDVVDAYMTIINSKNNLDQFNDYEVGNGKSISVKYFVKLIHKITKSKSKLLFGTIETRIDEIQDSKANNLNLIKLGWKPKINLELAITKMVTYYKFSNNY
jgi:nucleoside-diphosphate-sugar epimerase